MSNKKTVWTMVKPILVITLAALGYFNDLIFTNDISKEFFLLIIVASILTRGKGILEGFQAIFGKTGGELPPGDDDDPPPRRRK